MRLIRAEFRDITFIYDCLKLLRGDVVFSESELKEFLVSQAYFESISSANEILVGWENGIPRGILSCSRFNIPRYLGQGVELEEVIVAKEAQGLGFGSAMIESFLQLVEHDPFIRRVIVKTDDLDGAGGLYEKYFSETGYRTFSKRINDL